VKLWYPGTSTKTKTIKGHTSAVRSVEFSCDGQNILSASDDKSVKLWDIDTLKFKGSFIGHTNWVSCATMNGDSSLVASGGEDKKLMVWDGEKRKCIQKHECFDDAITSIKFHPTEQSVITATKSKTITMHDLRT